MKTLQLTIHIPEDDMADDDLIAFYSDVEKWLVDADYEEFCRVYHRLHELSKWRLDTLNELWFAIYNDYEWEYPAQAIRHVLDVISEYYQMKQRESET